MRVSMLLAHVKEQTREHHERLEGLLPLARSVDDHVAQLEGFFGFVEPWERALQRILPDDDPIRAGRDKTGWLVEDLEFFGVGPAQRQALARTPTLPPHATREEILGVSYVLEGSTLGGQYLARHLEEQLGFRDGNGYRYFRSYGTNVGARWQAFRAELLRASSPANDPVIIAAARATFDLLHNWFEIRLAHGRTDASRAAGPQHV